MTSIAKDSNQSINTWFVDVESDDNDTYSFEVTARTAKEAAYKATGLAAAQGIYNIYYMNIYKY